MSVQGRACGAADSGLPDTSESQAPAPPEPCTCVQGFKNCQPAGALSSCSFKSATRLTDEEHVSTVEPITLNTQMFSYFHSPCSYRGTDNSSCLRGSSSTTCSSGSDESCVFGVSVDVRHTDFSLGISKRERSLLVSAKVFA